MKIKNLVVGALLIGSLFTTVGCQSTQDCCGNSENLKDVKREELVVGTLLNSKYCELRDSGLFTDNELVMFDSAYDKAYEVYKETHCLECTNAVVNEAIFEITGDSEYKNLVNNHLAICNYNHDELDNLFSKVNEDANNVEEFTEETPVEVDANNTYCDNCGEIIPNDHIDGCGGYWCENCDYVK